MTCRYKLAKAMGKEAYRQALDEDRGLIGTFGLSILSVENGIRVIDRGKVRGDRVNPWDVIAMDPKLWKWLRPLLMELRELRGDESLG